MTRTQESTANTAAVPERTPTETNIRSRLVSVVNRVVAFIFKVIAQVYSSVAKGISDFKGYLKDAFVTHLPQGRIFDNFLVWLTLDQ